MVNIHHVRPSVRLSSTNMGIRYPNPNKKKRCRMPAPPSLKFGHGGKLVLSRIEVEGTTRIRMRARENKLRGLRLSHQSSPDQPTTYHYPIISLPQIADRDKQHNSPEHQGAGENDTAATGIEGQAAVEGSAAAGYRIVSYRFVAWWWQLRETHKFLQKCDDAG